MTADNNTGHRIKNSADDRIRSLLVFSSEFSTLEEQSFQHFAMWKQAIFWDFPL